MSSDDINISLSISKILAVSKEYADLIGVPLSPEFASEKLHEEVGEFAKICLVHRGLCRTQKRLPEEQSREQLGEELADILGWVVTNAFIYDIDLQACLEKKWFSKL
jgi:NTP pyrophosphatase (non-canonical NTP hydrolase)